MRREPADWGGRALCLYSHRHQTETRHPLPRSTGDTPVACVPKTVTKRNHRCLPTLKTLPEGKFLTGTPARDLDASFSAVLPQTVPSSPHQDCSRGPLTHGLALTHFLPRARELNPTRLPETPGIWHLLQEGYFFKVMFFLLRMLQSQGSMPRLEDAKNRFLNESGPRPGKPI